MDCRENLESIINGCRDNLSVSDTGQKTFSVPLKHNSDYSRSIELLIQALNEARHDSKLDDMPDDVRIGVVIGTTSASFLNDIRFHRRLRDGNLDQETLKLYLSGNPAEYVKHTLKLTGPAATVTNACSSGTDAVGIGLSWLNAGMCDIVFAGGCDELHSVSNAGFYSLGVLSGGLCRPFDGSRDGLNLGEGAGILVLERGESAEQRGAEIKASISSYGGSNDTHHITQPDPEGNGLERAVRKALELAGITPDDVGFINAHGTGTIHNDQAESKTFSRVFGGNCKYFSIKGCTGHTLGAAGAIEAAVTVELLNAGIIPASVGFESCGNGVELVPVTSTVNNSNAQYALSTSLAFGGCNSALIIKNEVLS